MGAHAWMLASVDDAKIALVLLLMTARKLDACACCRGVNTTLEVTVVLAAGAAASLRPDGPPVDPTVTLTNVNGTPDLWQHATMA